MTGRYDVFWNNKLAGKVEIARDGLYYQINCFCRLQDQGIYKLMLSCQEKTYNLGTLNPVRSGLAIRSRISAKKLDEGNWQFYLLKPGEAPSRFIPVREAEPFQYIRAISNARMDIQNEICGLIIPDQCLSQWDNDRSQEP